MVSSYPFTQSTALGFLYCNTSFAAAVAAARTPSSIIMSQNEVVELSQEQKDEFVQAFKNKFVSIERDPEQVLESLTPDVRKRVEKLQEIQKKHDDLEEKFIEEQEALEAKYEKLYQPLYAERSDIVNGAAEVEGVTEKTEVKGVPEFWLNVFKANAVLAQEISNRDEGALKYLKDIKWTQTEEPKGFKLEFFFDTNPYFKNTVLTKTYIMVDEDEIEKAIGTEIEWYEGKDLTKKLIQRKPKKGAKDDKPITKLKDCDSFFNFFKPPTVPENVEELDAEVAEELEIQMEQDYDIGSTLRDDVIPHAVSWFTGEASNDDDDIILVDGEDEDSDEDEDEEEEEAKAAEN